MSPAPLVTLFYFSRAHFTNNLALQPCLAILKVPLLNVITNILSLQELILRPCTKFTRTQSDNLYTTKKALKTIIVFVLT